MTEMFSVEHIGLAAQNPQQLKDWYEQVLGATLVFAMPQSPPAFLIQLGGVMIEIYSAQSQSDSTRNNRLAGWRHIALKVDSLEAAKEHLERKGVNFVEPIKPAGGGGRVLFFQDPEGNLLHLTERLSTGFQ
jgi:glyoxylase I family protein